MGRICAALVVVGLLVGCETSGSAVGVNGSLTQMAGIASVEECPNGGVVLEHGIDVNESGELDAAEVTRTHVVCHGANGSDADAATEIEALRTEVNALKAAVELNTAKVGYSDELVVAHPVVAANAAKVGFSDELVAANAAVVSNSAKNSITPAQSAAIVANSSKVGITPVQSTAISGNSTQNAVLEALIALNSAKTGLSPEQANAIAANTTKAGITAGQATAINANSAKVSFPGFGTVSGAALEGDTVIPNLVGYATESWVSSQGYGSAVDVSANSSAISGVDLTRFLCREGYAGDGCVYSDAVDCTGNATVNHDGTCTCKPGYTGDGVTCISERACYAENHCYLDEGEVACESGYQWVDPNAADDYRCEKVPRVDIPVLGNGTHTTSSVNLTVIASASDGLNTPRDVAFHPTVPGMLWVVNRGDTSMVILSDVATSSQSSVKKQSLSGGGLHFMAEPAALAFAASGKFATIHETDKETQGPVSQGGTPPDFMGPTLWPSDLNVFNAGHAGHLDMLHNSPLGMGIAWERDNVYWTFDGYHSSITRYDFGHDHGPGGRYHDDGTVSRYVEGQVKRTPDVVSHLEFDPATQLLYIADTGNNRVATLDTGTGTRGEDLPRGEVYDCYRHPGEGVTCADYHWVDGASLQTLVHGPDHGISQPSGLALHGGFVYVSDFETGTIYAFNKDGLLMDWLELGRPQSLGGIGFDSQGNLYIADTGAHQVLRISPL